MSMKDLKEFCGKIIVSEDGMSLRIVFNDSEMFYKKIGKLWYFDGSRDF